MGYTFFARKVADEVDAMEGKLCYGRENAVCDPARGRRDDGIAVPENSLFSEGSGATRRA